MDNRKKKIAKNVLRNMINEKNTIDGKKPLYFDDIMNNINSVLENEKLKPYSESTIRRLMEYYSLHKLKGGNGYITSESLPKLPKLLPLKVNSHLFFRITPEYFVPLIASMLNAKFNGEYFKAFSTGEMLICLYQRDEEYEQSSDDDYDEEHEQSSDVDCDEEYEESFDDDCDEEYEESFDDDCDEEYEESFDDGCDEEYEESFDDGCDEQNESSVKTVSSGKIPSASKIKHEVDVIIKQFKLFNGLSN